MNQGCLLPASPVPLEVTRCRHQAPVLGVLESGSKHGFRANCFLAGIDRMGTNFQVLRPSRNQPPAQSFHFIAIVAHRNHGLILRWADVVSRLALHQLIGQQRIHPFQHFFFAESEGEFKLPGIASTHVRCLPSSVIKSAASGLVSKASVQRAVKKVKQLTHAR
jgi:hypothetical protein